MHALIIGATGATGRDLLNFLLKDNSFERIDIFARRELGIQHEKLKTHLIDFNRPEQWKHLVKGDVLFSCLGTTLKAAGSKEAQWKIDYDYQYEFAKAARENNVPKLILVSASNASPNSMIFYSKMKGMLEVAVKALNFQQLDIFNPPLLIRKDTDRGGEIFAIKAIRYLNKLGLFLSQKPLPTEILAEAMIKAAKSNHTGIITYKGSEIWERARKMQ
jgi:uncharacterized protein YbjT (DUF2867 family)